MNIAQNLKVPGTWYEVDFHVHTPCSFDFDNQGESDDSTYIELLKKAKESKLDIIVCTDHNDIKGYQKLCEIHNDLLGTIRTLKRNQSDISESLLSQMNLFEEVVYLPGVELDIKPCLHFLVIFDPSRIELITEFLDNAGFTHEIRGHEDSATYWKWNIDNLYNEADKVNAIVLGAHVDSSKGLYNETERWGRGRIDAFVNDSLYGMEFINPVQRDIIGNILREPKYSRRHKLSFVQSSDYHGKSNQTIGERRTYVRMDEGDKSDRVSVFNALKRALRNPDEYISAPGRPELQVILEKLKDQPFVESIQKESDRRKFNELICAYANSEGGTVTIGKSQKGNWIGVSEQDEEKITLCISDVIKSSISPHPVFGIDVYPYGNKFIASVQVKKNLRVCSLTENDSVYLLESNQPKLASSKDLIDLIETRLIERYSKLSITNKLYDMSHKLSGIQDSIDVLPIVRKIDKNSHYLMKDIKPPALGEIFTDEFISEEIDMPWNGVSEGDVVVLKTSKPRFEDSYLRISAPKGKLIGSSINMAKYNGEKVIITSGGAVYYDDSNDIVIGCQLFSPTIFTSLMDSCQCSLKFLAAYLKSSIIIWYAKRCLGSFDLRRFLIANIPIPENISSNFCQSVENRVDDLITLEKNYLDEVNDLDLEADEELDTGNTESEKLTRTLTDNHNKHAGYIMGEIDSLFYDFFGLSPKEVETIEQDLTSSNLAVFPKVPPHEEKEGN